MRFGTQNPLRFNRDGKAINGGLLNLEAEFIERIPFFIEPLNDSQRAPIDG